MSLKQCCALGRCVVTKGLKACSACSEVVYCCKDHQVEHFKEGGHKMVCPGRAKGPPLSFKECNDRAQKYYADKMWLASMPYFGAMLELTERQVGLFHPQVANIMEAMSYSYKMLQKYEQSIQCLQRVVLLRDMEQDESPDKTKKVFNTMGQLAELYLLAGNAELAKQLLIKTEETAKELFGTESFEVGRVLGALGGCLERNGETEEAIKTMQKSIAIKQYSDSSVPAELAAASTTFYNLGLLHSTNDNKAEALKHIKASYDMKIKAGLAPDHVDVVECRDLISSLQSQ